MVTVERIKDLRDHKRGSKGVKGKNRQEQEPEQRAGTKAKTG
jgi:hypothetical protein